MSDEMNRAAEPQPTTGNNMAPAQAAETATRSGDGRTQAQNSDSASEAQVMLPLVDVVEDAGGITLYADLPGVPKENLTLHLERDNLTIEAQVALDIPQEMQASIGEVASGRFRRQFALSKELDGEQTSAELSNGVLTLRIPKAQHAQPRKIAINVA